MSFQKYSLILLIYFGFGNIISGMEMAPTGFNLDSAVHIAIDAHQGQVDKAGIDYIIHPFAVMNLLQGDTAKMTGVLHDVVEDTSVTFEELVGRGCPPEVIEALKLVTHPEGFENTEENYLKWVHDIANSGNQTAIDVKWADLTNNTDPTRIQNPTEKDLKRTEKYKKSLDILRPLVSSYLLGDSTEETYSGSHYLRFRERFGKMSEEELVGSFNREVGNTGWVSARGDYLFALREELEKRGIDFSAVGNENSISLRNKVTLSEERRLVILPSKN